MVRVRENVSCLTRTYKDIFLLLVGVFFLEVVRHDGRLLFLCCPSCNDSRQGEERQKES